MRLGNAITAFLLVALLVNPALAETVYTDIGASGGEAEWLSGYDYVRIVETPDDQAYIPFELYVFFLGITVVLFILSLLLQASAKFTSIASTVMFFMMSALSWAIEFHGVKTVILNQTEMYVVPYSYVVSAPYLSAILIAFALGGILNVVYLWFIQTKEITGQLPNNRRY